MNRLFFITELEGSAAVDWSTQTNIFARLR